MPLAATAQHGVHAARWRAAGQWGDTALAEAFARTVVTRGTAVALIDEATQLTFVAWQARVERCAAALADLGVGPGDVVAYQLPNWWEAATVFLAAVRLGAVANPVLPIFRARELAFILAQSGAAVLVIPGAFRGTDYRDLITPLRAALPALRHVIVVRDEPAAHMLAFESLLAAGRPLPDIAVDADALSMLMYTSGTTAQPKGVLHTHNTLLAEVRSLQRIHNLRADDRTLMPSPLTHISGVIHAILTPALVGSSAVLMERWDPRAAQALIARQQVTYMVGAPTFLQDLVDSAPRDGVQGSLRLFSCGGAPVSAELIQRARRQLGCVAKRVYGSTEFPTITTTDASDAAQMGSETEGRAIDPGCVRIVDGDGRAVSTGDAGEVQAIGPERCVGYVDTALNADAFTDDGWLRTGDLGTLDGAGYLRITGRLKDIVIRKGEKFSVRELEDAIAQHPAVAEVAVLALPDTRSGERACAVVVLRAAAELTLDALCTFLLGEGLAKQKLPEQLEVLPALPRTDSGKVQRGALRERFGARP